MNTKDTCRSVALIFCPNSVVTVDGVRVKRGSDKTKHFGHQVHLFTLVSRSSNFTFYTETQIILDELFRLILIFSDDLPVVDKIIKKQR